MPVIQNVAVDGFDNSPEQCTCLRASSLNGKYRVVYARKVYAYKSPSSFWIPAPHLSRRQKWYASLLFGTCMAKKNLKYKTVSISNTLSFEMEPTKSRHTESYANDDGGKRISRLPSSCRFATEEPESRGTAAGATPALERDRQEPQDSTSNSIVLRNENVTSTLPMQTNSPRPRTIDRSKAIVSMYDHVTAACRS